MAEKNVGCIITRKKEECKDNPKCIMTLEPLPMPIPKDDEVLLKIMSVGICGSDVHYWQHGAIGDFILAPGQKMLLGHECAGIVVACGSHVEKLQIGDRVAIEPGVTCGSCNYCRSGRYNLCPKVIFWATPPYDGALCNYVAHKASYCFRIPDSMSFDEGTVVEPFSVGIQACRRGGVHSGDKVLVMGAGPIGLVTVLAAKGFDAAEITVCDILPERLEVAKQCGATQTLLVKPADSSYKVHEKLSELVDCTLDCTGNEWCLTQGILATRPAGKVVMTGLSQPSCNIPTVVAVVREIDLLGNFRYCNTWPTAIEMISSGKVNVRQIVTHTYRFENESEVMEAFETSHKGKDKNGKFAIKVVLRLDE